MKDARKLDRSDPEGMAGLLLLFGYDAQNVLNALVKRCSLDRMTARRIVLDVARQQGVDVSKQLQEGPR